MSDLPNRTSTATKPKKRPASPFVPPFLPAKAPKLNPIYSSNPSPTDLTSETPTDKMVKILADAGCTLINPNGPPSLPSDPHRLRSRLQSIFSSPAGSSSRAQFVDGFASYIQSHHNFHRVLVPSSDGGLRSTRGCHSLARHLLLVPSIQLHIQTMLLEKLPEYFDASSSLSLDDDVARLILHHFRWLDFVVDSDALIDKLMEVLSISPLHLKKEIIGSLPEIVGDRSSKAVIDSLEKILQEDSSIIVPVLDSFSNISLDDQLQEQVITIAISCIRTVDAEDMPYLLRFLMLSATPVNVRRIISQIREKLKFVGVSNFSMLQQKKLKGKSNDKNFESLILDALKSSLLFKNILCQEILKELKSLESARDYTVIDVWLLMLIYMNGDSMRKTVEKLFKNKIIDGCFEEALIDQCVQGNKELDFFQSFVSLSEHLLSSKAQKAREFANHMYISLFKEFRDTYSRQEILGALLTHVGSGIDFEVSSALQTIVFLASEHSHELIPLSSFINGIFDYLEGFSVKNLHKVYEAFSLLALTARESVDSFGHSISNELLMIVRKQVTNPDIKYKKMGLIGTLKIVSCFGDATKSRICPAPSQVSKSIYLFSLIGKHVSDFESNFLSDLVGGQLPTENSIFGLEGELWMNLDGNISPICLKILPLTKSPLRSASFLQTLPVDFRLLCFIEWSVNQGSLGGIDALLGCPLHLPSHKYLTGAAFRSLTNDQRHIICSSLYYAANWIRELINAFSTQVTGRFACASQAMKEEILLKLSKRFRNLIFLESLLNSLLEMCPTVLPAVYVHAEIADCALSKQTSPSRKVDKTMEQQRTQCSFSQSNSRKKESASKNLEGTKKLKQPTLFDVLTKAGAIPPPKATCEGSSGLTSQRGVAEAEVNHILNPDEQLILEVSAAMKFVEAQRFKFRPLQMDSLLVLSVLQSPESCCTDPAAELPLYLYIVRDLHYKLDNITSPNRQLMSKCSIKLPDTRIAHDILLNISRLFPSLKKQFDRVLQNLKEDTETCDKHWGEQSASAGNPDTPSLTCAYSSVIGSFCNEVLYCFTKTLNLLDSQEDNSALLHLLESFQPIRIEDNIFMGIDTAPPGSINYLYCGTFSYLESALDIAYSFSFVLASEALLSLKSIVDSAQKILNCVDKTKKSLSETNQSVISCLGSRLGDAAQRFLRHHWGGGKLEAGSKSKGEFIRKILNIYLVNSGTTSDLLEQLACITLPQVPSSNTAAGEDIHGFPTLCSSTFAVWYRVLNEQNLVVLNNLVKVVVHCKRGTGCQVETFESLLVRLQQLVNVLVSLVDMCRTHHKVNVHAMSVKYGGKFIDSFLKVFDVLQEHFNMHSEPIIKLVTELQKATRTIQTLCSDAKGFKQTNITSNVPATKRSMERFLFRVKALLQVASNGCSFWMGTLKHKDLMGQLVSSQVYMEQTGDLDVNSTEDVEDHSVHAASARDDETEIGGDSNL
uniref:Fanconi anemia group D2 protein n=1 Tax=Kalanchoe fedtschenkoi TaxID=63787 RepID=A0A7N0RJX2_KALFE